MRGRETRQSVNVLPHRLAHHGRMTRKLVAKRLVTALGAGTAVFALGMGGAGIANAEPPFTCQNGGGNTPQGNCNGGGLHTVNPGGHAPGGFNK